NEETPGNPRRWLCFKGIRSDGQLTLAKRCFRPLSHLSGCLNSLAVLHSLAILCRSPYGLLSCRCIRRGKVGPGGSRPSRATTPDPQPFGAACQSLASPRAREKPSLDFRTPRSQPFLTW